MDNRFNAGEAGNYDDAIKRRIPLYNEIQMLIVSLPPFSKKEYIKVLDLGCGTGATSIVLLKEFPLAKVTAVDSSPDMLKIATAKVKHTTWKVEFLCQDINTFNINGEFNAVVSGFSLHYFNADEKNDIFKKCLSALKPGGMFIEAGAILSQSEKVYNYYMEKWKDFQRSNGFSDEEIGSHLLKFTRDVKPVTIDRQLEIMSKAGFTDVECYFKYMNWAVFGGYK